MIHLVAIIGLTIASILWFLLQRATGGSKTSNCASCQRKSCSDEDH